MGDVQLPLGLRRTATVHQDWLAWLPAEKDQLFAATVEELEVSYSILSVALDDAFTLCQLDKAPIIREQARMFAGLFDCLVDRLRGVLRTLDEHSRHLGMLPNVAPLQPEFFRGEYAQRVARTNFLLSLMVFRTRARFFRKLTALTAVIDELQTGTHAIVAVIAGCPPVSLSSRWRDLEVLDYDLNTCLRETTVMLKSFFCVLPSEELAAFGKRLGLGRHAHNSSS